MACALALVVAACGSGAGSSPGDSPTEATTTPAPSDSSTSTIAVAFPITIETANGPVTIEERPARIVSISPTSTEVLFAIGAGEQVVAVDSLSNYPESAPVTELSAFTPSVEAIIAQDPDLVFLSYDPADIVAGLAAVGIPAIVHGTPAGLDDAFTQWEQVGAATGHVADATLLLAQVQADLDAAFGSVPDGAAELTYYYELEPTLYSATATTFIGELLAGTTMTNIADDQDPDGYGYPQLSAEYIVDADPDLILLADTLCCDQSAATIAERPGWATLTAVTAGSILELDDDIASRWGPRIVELVEDVVAAMRTFDAANA
jgi:iron complex transport system substrate-binding protein